MALALAIASLSTNGQLYRDASASRVRGQRREVDIFARGRGLAMEEMVNSMDSGMGGSGGGGGPGKDTGPSATPSDYPSDVPSDTPSAVPTTSNMGKGSMKETFRY